MRLNKFFCWILKPKKREIHDKERALGDNIGDRKNQKKGVLRRLLGRHEVPSSLPSSGLLPMSSQRVPVAGSCRVHARKPDTTGLRRLS